MTPDPSNHLLDHSNDLDAHDISTTDEGSPAFTTTANSTAATTSTAAHTPRSNLSVKSRPFVSSSAPPPPPANHTTDEINHLHPPLKFEDNDSSRSDVVKTPPRREVLNRLPFHTSSVFSNDTKYQHDHVGESSLVSSIHKPACTVETETAITFVDIPQNFSFVHKPPNATTYRFDLKDASTISPHQLDEEIRTTLLDGAKAKNEISAVATSVTRRAGSNISAFRVIKTLTITAAGNRRHQQSQKAALLEAGRENRRVERDRRRALAARSRAVAVGGSSPTSSASSGSTEKMRCLRCLTLETPQWRYIHKGRYCNACYMRVKRWVENNRPGRKLPSRVKNPLSPDEDARLQKDADDLVSQAFEALERQGI